MSKVCRTSQSALNQADNGRSKRSWSTSEENYIRSRAKMEQRRLDLAKKQGTTELEARNLDELQRAERMISEYQSVATDMMQLNPKEFNRMENNLARTLGIHKRRLGLGDDFTQSGKVRLQIADMQVSAQNLVDVVARYAFKKTTNDALADINRLLRTRGITPDTAKEFINNVAEVAKSPRQRVAYGNTDAVNAIINRRYNNMIKEADDLGLSRDDMNIIVDRLTKSMSVVDDVHAMAKVMGASMDSVENVGYMMRSFTDKAQKYFNLKSVDTAQWTQRAVGTSSVQRSRESWSLIPEDYEVLAQHLMPGKYKLWDDTVSSLLKDVTKSHIDKVVKSGARNTNTPQWQSLVDLFPSIASKHNLKVVAGRKAFVSEVVDAPLTYLDLLKRVDGDEVKAAEYLANVTGKTVAELDALRFSGLDDMVVDLQRMADDGQSLTLYLHKNLTAQQLDDLVDAGIISKLEMTTRDVADYISKQYQLPYQKAMSMFEYDIPKRIESYTHQLRKSAGESILIKNLVGEGINKGWAVPSSLVNGIEHPNFVKLGDIDLKRFGLDPKLADEWQGVHVHPTVSAQLKAYLELSTNPGKLGAFSNVWAYVLRNFNLPTLTANGVAFLSRNMISGLINLVAGGGNILRAIPSIHEYAKVVGKGGLESLDDTRKYIKWVGTDELITKREAFKRMFIKRGTDYVSAESGNKLGVNSDLSGMKRVVQYAGEALPIIALPNAVRAQMDYARFVGDGWSIKEAAKLAGQQLDDYVRTTFAPIAYGNAVVDGGLKWAWMMTRLDTADGVGKLDDFGKYVTGGKQYKDAFELFDDMDNYFVNSATMGTAQKTLARYVIPFGTYAMMSTPMAIRHAVRNPNQFMAYNRLIRMNHREHMKDPDMRESGFSDFELAGIPMTLFKDYDKKGQVLALFPTNVDMYQGSLAYLAKQGQRVGRLVNEGGFVGQGTKDRAQLRDPYGLRDFVVDNLKDNQNPVMGIVSELLSGKDSLGRDIDKNENTYVGGVKVDPNMFWVLSKLPGFTQANNSINGRGAITSPNGTIESPAQPGLFGTPQREATRTEEARYRASQFVGPELYGVIRNVLGLDVRTIDLAEGRQQTLKDVRYTITSLQKKVNELNSKEPSAENAQRRELLSNQILQLKVDEHRVSQWLTANNVPDPKALKKLYKEGITVRSLPANKEHVDKLIQEYLVNSGRVLPQSTPSSVRALPQNTP